MWYAELQLDYVDLKYTPEYPGFLSSFLHILKQQCIRIWLCKLVRCANKWSKRYWILSLDRLSLSIKDVINYTWVKQILIIHQSTENHQGHKILNAHRISISIHSLFAHVLTMYNYSITSTHMHNMYTYFRCARNRLYYTNYIHFTVFAEVKVLQQNTMLNMHHMLILFKWNYEQYLYKHTFIPMVNRFASLNGPLTYIMSYLLQSQHAAT